MCNHQLSANYRKLRMTPAYKGLVVKVIRSCGFTSEKQFLTVGDFNFILSIIGLKGEGNRFFRIPGSAVCRTAECIAKCSGGRGISATRITPRGGGI